MTCPSPTGYTDGQRLPEVATQKISCPTGKLKHAICMAFVTTPLRLTRSKLSDLKPGYDAPVDRASLWLLSRQSPYPHCPGLLLSFQPLHPPRLSVLSASAYTPALLTPVGSRPVSKADPLRSCCPFFVHSLQRNPRVVVIA